MHHLSPALGNLSSLIKTHCCKDKAPHTGVGVIAGSALVHWSGELQADCCVCEPAGGQHIVFGAVCIECQFAQLNQT